MPRLVAVTDTSLRIVLAAEAASTLLVSGEPLIGRALQDVVPGYGPSLARRLALLLRGVAGEIVVSSLGDGDVLVATLAQSEVPGTEPWVLLTARQAGPALVSHRLPFVGRAEQLDAFDAFLAGPDGALLAVEGPVGIGKSALLEAFEARCRELACPVFLLDARTTSLDSGLLEALAAQYDGVVGRAGRFAMPATNRRCVVMVDDFDVPARSPTFGARDPFRGVPEGWRVVVAVRSRNLALAAIGTRYRTLFCRLGPLGRDESRALATRLGMLPSTLLRRADGHPLSIHALAQGRAVDADVADRLLLAGDLPLSRDMLEVASMPGRITEEVLTALLDDDALAARTYDALSVLAYHRADEPGVRIPQVVRGALLAQLRRRNPTRHALLLGRLARHYVRRVEAGDALGLAVLDDLIAAFEDSSALAVLLGAVAPAGLVTRRVGLEALERVEAFLEEQRSPDAEGILARLGDGIATYVVEPEEPEVPGSAPCLGVLQYALMTASEPPCPSDRRRSAVRAFVGRSGGGDGGRVGALLAFVVSESGWSGPGQALLRRCVRLLFGTQHLTALVTVVEGTAARLALPGAELVEIDGVRLRVRDLRHKALGELLLTLLQSPESVWDAPESRSSVPPAMPLETVRAALAALDQPSALRSIALVSGLADAQPSSLRTMLVDAIATLATDDDPRAYEILKAVYLDRRGKHELVAAELGIPYSTFRRHLARGIERVRELLIERASSAGVENPRGLNAGEP